MSVIVPAILPSSREDLDNKLARFSELADNVQIDVIDGRFATPASWPYTGGSEELARLANAGGNLPYWGKMKFEIDLMVRHPEEVTGSCITLGASRITIHAESTTYLPRIITDFDTRYGHDPAFSTGLISFGLAIGLSTDMNLIEPYIPHADYVQFMGIGRIGKQGEPFDTRVIERVKAFRKRHPDTQIQVDGGISKLTAPALLSAGVERLIVGSDLLYAPDMKKEFNALQELTEEYGLYE